MKKLNGCKSYKVNYFSLYLFLFICVTSIRTSAQDIFGRYDYVLKFYNVDEKKVDISTEIILNLNKDNTYSYVLHDKKMKAADTGIYKIKKDTIYFQSKYPEGPMHGRYYLTAFDESFNDDIITNAYEDLDSTEWYYLRISAGNYYDFENKIKIPLSNGFNFRCEEISVSYRGDLTEGIFEMYLPKEQIRQMDMRNSEIYFQDLNLMLNLYGKRKYRFFKNAMVLRVQTDREKIPKDWFYTPKTLKNVKMLIRGDKLLFIKRNGEIHNDTVFEKHKSPK